MQKSAKASARKSLSEYKPLIVYPNGQTEVCEKSPERSDRHTKKGVVKGNRMARGNTYLNKEDAIASAQNIINIRRQDALRRYNEWSTIPGRESGAERALQEAILWGAEMS